MKHKVSELAEEALDAAVALALGWTVERFDGEEVWHDARERFQKRPLPFSSMWQYGGQLIERERIECCPLSGRPSALSDQNRWMASVWKYDGIRETATTRYGSAPLIAAMRAYVASKLGEEVELP